jgi:hypothetical protein
MGFPDENYEATTEPHSHSKILANGAWLGAQVLRLRDASNTGRKQYECPLFRDGQLRRRLPQFFFPSQKTGDDQSAD